MMPHRLAFLFTGVLFALLWSSASSATKIGLGFAQPFVIAVPRFLLGGSLMLFAAHVLLRKRLPRQKEWLRLAVYGFFNVAVYLGLYVVAMQQVSAGLGSLAVGTNPVLISLFSALWFRKKITTAMIASLLLCSAGIVIAAWPLLRDSYATPLGLALLLTSMLSYSAASLYFSQTDWGDLHILTINGWQTILGGVALLPVLFFTYNGAANNFTPAWFGVVLWLAVPVSIGAVQLWLYLLRADAVRASFWLYLCPVFGFTLAALILREPVSMHTGIGVAVVIAGLYLVQRQKGRPDNA